LAAERHNVSRRTVLGAGAAATVIAVAGPRAAGQPPIEASAAAPSSSPPKAGPRASARIDFVCARCRGSNVTSDTVSRWDAATQRWIITGHYDWGECYDCEEETRLEEVEAPDAAGREAD